MLQEIKQIFYIMYLFDEMFSDSANEWLNTDVRFFPAVFLIMAEYSYQC
jgi:TRAP-type mannitol/chloroaromatic compound transport system permease small subunit